MPWKGEKDPYKIWLSEIILQQTRVEQGLGYYNKFIRVFPDVHRLAKAPEKKVFKLWEGLGYYSRCRHLVATAKYISNEKKGVFPDTYEDIKSLKGIGPYTAAAIASFAFNLPYAVVDGNVFRVLARVFGIHKPIDSTEGKKYFTYLAGQLLDKKQPGLYNQAIMDFGAVVCRPVSPLCPECVFKKDCYAFQQDAMNGLPVKEKKIKIRQRWLYYLQLHYNGRIAIRKRNEKDIWQSLYEFPLVEAGKETASGTILDLAAKKYGLNPEKLSLKKISPLHKQQLSHQLIKGQLLYLELDRRPAGLQEWLWVYPSQRQRYPFPKYINDLLQF